MLFVIHPMRGVLVELFSTLIGVDLLAHGVKAPHDWELIGWGVGLIVVSLIVAASSFRWIVRGIRTFLS
jgi:hypothetical protein